MDSYSEEYFFVLAHITRIVIISVAVKLGNLNQDTLEKPLLACNFVKFTSFTTGLPSDRLVNYTIDS